jgi:hypothetical protein
MIDALWPENRFFKPLLCYASCRRRLRPLFPTASAYYPLSFLCNPSFVLHASIVAYIIARYSSGEIGSAIKAYGQRPCGLCMVIPIILSMRV